jgi:hypothetical protein
MPPHDQNAVTVGECVAALVLTILTGEHAVSRVAATLAVYDLAVIVQRPLDAAHFHDHRLGLTLDAPWATGLDRVYGVVMASSTVATIVANKSYVLALHRFAGISWMHTAPEPIADFH